MSFRTAASARTKVHDVMDAIADGSYHNLAACTPSSSETGSLQQRIRAFSDEHQHQKQGAVQQQQDLLKLARVILVSFSEATTAMGGGGRKLCVDRNISPDDEEKHILQWLEEMRNRRSSSRSPGQYCREEPSSLYHSTTFTTSATTSQLDGCETTPVFQRTLDFSGTKGSEMKVSRTLALVFPHSGLSGAPQSSRLGVGVLLLLLEEEVAWKFHGVACFPAGSEKSLISEGWRRIQEQEEVASPTVAIHSTTTTQRTQEQQQKLLASKHHVQEDDDSDDDYWGQYGDPDSDSEDTSSKGSGSRGGDACCSPTQAVVSYPSSSSASSHTALSPSSYHPHHHPAGTAKTSTATTTETGNTVFTEAFSRNFISRAPNNCQWEDVGEDEDDDDEYWGKYGDQDGGESEPESKQGQQLQRHSNGQEQNSEVLATCTTTMSKDSSHANNSNNNSMAERQITLVPTAFQHQPHHQQQKQARYNSEEHGEALPNSGFPSLLAPVPIHAPVPVVLLEPGQVDPTALSLRLMNLIAHHSDPTGFSTEQQTINGLQQWQHYHYDSDDLGDNEASTDDKDDEEGGGFLIRLDSRLQHYHDAVTPLFLPFQSEHLPDIEDTNRNNGDSVPLDIININKDEEAAIQAPSTLSSIPAPALFFVSPHDNTDNNAGSTSFPFPTSSSQSRFQSQKSLSTTISTSSSSIATILPHQPPPSHSADDHQQQQTHQRQQQDESLSPSNSCTDLAFQEYINPRSDNTTANRNNCLNASTSLVEHDSKSEREQVERDHFLRSLRAMTQEAKTILGLSKEDLLDILDQTYDSPSSVSTVTPIH
ncbi:MAG: hypothetical protein J3R72DRAFT_432245 [Linnemannia gamsii]|nr:MAG: hypothetical protein J3R72DRAFT_432245 [Linnemannia gamsii]